MASPAGDEGRDSELFSPDSDPTVLLQYSVTSDWTAKIRKTAVRIAGKKPSLLVYASNQDIGARADDLRREVWKEYGFRLDIRDRSWFVERVNSTPERQAAAEDLAYKHVDPYLAEEGVFEAKAAALDDNEAKAAFTYLGLQWEDDSQDKGLTKLAFEALVCSALHGTDLEHRRARSEVLERVRRLLPSHDTREVDRLANAALARLQKKRVRHYRQPDEFCLSHEEVLRVTARLLEREQQEEEFRRELEGAISAARPGANVTVLVPFARRLLERFLYERGEQFASAAAKGTYETLDLDALNNLALAEFKSVRSRKITRSLPACTAAVRSILQAPSSHIQTYLRTIADSYTLFAFLRETPDVQSVVAKMFSHGDIWLDASTILPALAETLFDADDLERRVISRLLKAASVAGLKLHVTDGMLEELERHMFGAASCARRPLNTWRGKIPFLYSAYIAQGKNPSSFEAWLTTFRGDRRPVDDIAAYLKTFFDISRTELAEVTNKAPERLRQRVSALWQEAHDRRRDGADRITANRLAAHDAEVYLGVLERRRGEREEPFGYTSWMLTLDRRAYGIDRAIQQEFRETLGSPLMTPDFLSNYLAFGPIRRRVTKDVERNLPVIVDPSILASLPVEIIDVAEKTRKEAAGLPDYRIQREVRDRVERAKQRRGQLAYGGIENMERKITGRTARGRRRPTKRRTTS